MVVSGPLLNLLVAVTVLATTLNFLRALKAFPKASFPLPAPPAFLEPHPKPVPLVSPSPAEII